MDDFIKCQYCNQSVPAGFGVCQFCKTSLAGVARPNPQRQNYLAYEDDHNTQYFGKPTWVTPAYNTVCVYFILSALAGIFVVVSKIKGSIEPLHIVAISFHSIGLVLGIGLLAKVEFIRGIVNIVCGVKLLFGLLSIPQQLLTTSVTGVFGVLGTILTVIDIITNALMIYLIGETD